MNRDEAEANKANLRGANLEGANLAGAHLEETDLHGANLARANLAEAHLAEAHLEGAHLEEADLRWANLQLADLRGANLEGANLHGANLKEANLTGANLRWADLTDVTGLPASIIPAGMVIGWKKGTNEGIIQLEIAAETPRMHAIGSRKCRCAKATVVGFYACGKPEGLLNLPCIGSIYDSEFQYTVGMDAVPDSYDPDVRVECSHGIHFFLTRAEAEAWQ